MTNQHNAAAALLRVLDEHLVTNDFGALEVSRREVGTVNDAIEDMRQCLASSESVLTAAQKADIDAAAKVLYVQGDAKLAEKLWNITGGNASVGSSATPSAGTIDTPDAQELYMRAIEATYPIPDSPHNSVIQRAMDNRIAFRFGWEQAIRALASQPATTAQTDEVTNELSADRDAPLRGAPAAADVDAMAAEMKRLHDALCFWLPQHRIGNPPEMLERIAADAYLLVGYDDMPDPKSAEELGWITTAAAAAPVAQAPVVQDRMVPLRIEFEQGYQEDVAFGSQAQMDRLKKWLDKYFAIITAPVAAPTQVAPVLTDADMDQLHSAIMNLPCRMDEYPQYTGGEKNAHMFGHRDARHAAAELVAATQAECQPQPADELVRAGWFLYEGIEWTPTSSDDPRATILYRKAAIQQDQQVGKDGAACPNGCVGPENGGSGCMAVTGDCAMDSAATQQQGERSDG